MEIYRKPAIGRVHLESSPGSTCFRLFPGIGFDHCTTTTRVGKNPECMRATLQSNVPTFQSKENGHDEI
jgi:hypothetical protein